MALPGRTRGSWVSICTIARNRRARGDRSVQKGVAAFCAAGERSIDEEGSSRRRRDRRRTVACSAAIAEVGKLCGKAGAVRVLIDDLRSIDGAKGSNGGGF